MDFAEAFRFATCTDYVPTPHEQAGASAVLADEVIRLEAIVECCAAECPPDDNLEVNERVAVLAAEAKRLRTALRFYAGKENYSRQLTGEGSNQYRSPVLEDGGQRARAAIGGK